MTNHNDKPFWNRKPADRNAARARLMAAGAGWGDASGEGIVVPVLRGSADDIIVTAQAVNLHVVGSYDTVMTVGGLLRTVRMLELA